MAADEKEYITFEELNQLTLSDTDSLSNTSELYISDSDSVSDYNSDIDYTCSTL